MNDQEQNNRDWDEHLAREEARDRCYYHPHLRERDEERAAAEKEREQREADLQRAFELAPPAIMDFDPATEVFTVCAWPHCHGPDAKGVADAWCEARGYKVSHGMCPVCFAKECPDTVAANKAIEECTARAKELTAYADGVALNLRQRRAEVLGVSLEELARRDALDLQQMAEDKMEEDRQEANRRHYFEQSADYVAELTTEGRISNDRLASIHSLPMGQARDY